VGDRRRPAVVAAAARGDGEEGAGLDTRDPGRCTGV
jgi:hypothetical protein